MKFGSALACIGAAFAVGGATAATAQRTVVDEGLVIEDVTLISPERRRPLALADVVIVDGRIARVGTNLVAGGNARRIDGRGRFLIPGLIDSHVHINSLGGLYEAAESRPELAAAYRRQLPRAYLAFGFTTIADLDLRARDRVWFSAAPLRPRLIGCGRALRIAGGYGAVRIPPDVTSESHPYLIYEAAQARSWPAGLAPADHGPAAVVARSVALGAQCIKLFVEPGFGGAFNWPVPRPETLRAIRDESRRRNLPFFVHATGIEAWRAAIDADAGVIAHGLWHWPGERLDPAPPPEARALIAAARRDGIAVQPSLRAVVGQRSIFDPYLLEDPRLASALPALALAHLRSAEAEAGRRAVAQAYRQAAGAQDAEGMIAVGGERARATLRLMHLAGIRLLLGSDTGGGEGMGEPPGLNGRLELQHWAETGIPLDQILRAATLDNARALGLGGELGSIEVGKRADLLLLSANPLASVMAYDAIETVFVDGAPVSRNDLRPGD